MEKSNPFRNYEKKNIVLKKLRQTQVRDEWYIREQGIAYTSL